MTPNADISAPQPYCSTPGCFLPVYSKHLCRRHYNQAWKQNRVATAFCRSHPHRPVEAKGLCKACYMRHWQRSRPAAVAARQLKARLLKASGARCSFCGSLDYELTLWRLGKRYPFTELCCYPCRCRLRKFGWLLRAWTDWHRQALKLAEKARPQQLPPSY